MTDTRIFLLSLLLAPSLLSGCATSLGKHSRPLIDLGVVENLTGEVVRDVRVKHMPTRAIASFSAILADRRAEIGFSPRELMADEGEIAWLIGTQRYKVRLLMPVYGQRSSQPLVLVYQLLPGGQARVLLPEAG